VVKDPEARVRFRAFGNSSLDFELLCWIGEPSLRGLVTHIILKQIYHAFAREKITIPFPQIDVHMKREE
jgi:small-conductance mechanosensitive channel